MNGFAGINFIEGSPCKYFDVAIQYYDNTPWTETHQTKLWFTYLLIII